MMQATYFVKTGHGGAGAAHPKRSCSNLRRGHPVREIRAAAVEAARRPICRICGGAT